MTVCRFAPSPTGHLHVGNLRTALLNFLIARRAGGTFILRLDDTDRERSSETYADAIRTDLEWLGLAWDREERQSARLERYHGAKDELIRSGRLYECFETPAELELKRKMQRRRGQPPVYDRTGLHLPQSEKAALRAERAGHWRFLLDRERVDWTDRILGEVSVDAASVSDPILIRGDGQFLYTLASVCDDIDFHVTDVVRGSDHVTNTATQVQIFRSLSCGAPDFAHHSLLTGPDGEALGKRIGAMSLRDLRDAGIEPMALLSHLARLGTSAPVQLRASLDELAQDLDLSRFGAAPAKFDARDARALTSRYLSSLPVAEVMPDLVSAGVPVGDAQPFWEAIRENLDVRADIGFWWRLCTDGADSRIEPADRDYVAAACSLLPPQPWDGGTWQSWTARVGQATGRKGRSLYLPLRMALTGRSRGPDMSRLMPFMKGAVRYRQAE